MLGNSKCDIVTAVKDFVAERFWCLEIRSVVNNVFVEKASCLIFTLGQKHVNGDMSKVLSQTFQLQTGAKKNQPQVQTDGNLKIQDFNLKLEV